MRGFNRKRDDHQRSTLPVAPPGSRYEEMTEPASVGQAPADFFSSMAVLGRRWKVVGAGIVATVLVAMAAVTAIPPTYKANGSSFLAVASDANLSATPGDAQPKNPYLAFGGSLNATAELMAKSMNGEQMHAKVAALGGTGDYVTDLAPGDAPVLTISATGKTPEEALTTEKMATQILKDELTNSQLDLGAKNDLIRTKEVLIPEHAVKQQTSRIRALIGVLVLGLSATVMAAFLVESLAQHRAKSRVPRSVGNSGEVRPLTGRRGDPPEPRVDSDASLDRLRSLLDNE